VRNGAHSRYLQVFSLSHRLFRLYTGTDGVYTHTFESEKKPECPVCGGESKEISAPASQTLEDFLEDLKGRADM